MLINQPEYTGEKLICQHFSEARQRFSPEGTGKTAPPAKDFPVRREATAFSVWKDYDGIVPHNGEGRKETIMENLTREYLLLFNALTDVEQVLRELRERVVSAQQAAEELYISGGEAKTQAV